VIQLFHPREQETLHDKVSEVPCLNKELQETVEADEWDKLMSGCRCLDCGELLDECGCIKESTDTKQETDEEDDLPF
jgi:hypothetical protein